MRWAVLASMINLPRTELHKKVVQGPEIQEMLHQLLDLLKMFCPSGNIVSTTLGKKKEKESRAFLSLMCCHFLSSPISTG